MIRTLTLSALGTALVAGTAAAQAPAPGRAPATATTPASSPASAASAKAAVADPLFAAAAAAGGLAEVGIAQLGIQRATDADLKQFSQQMVEEHTRANQELMALAAQKRITLPRALDPRAQFCAQSLAGLSGRDFDRCYAKAQLVTHLDAVATFEAEAERGQDPEVKAFAAKWLPHIQEHLRMIKPIAMRYEQEKPSTGHAAIGRSQAQPADSLSSPR